MQMEEAEGNTQNDVYIIEVILGSLKLCFLKVSVTSYYFNNRTGEQVGQIVYIVLC